MVPMNLGQNEAMPYAWPVSDEARPRLFEIDPNDTQGLVKESGKELAKSLGERWDELEDLLFFSGQNSLLIIFQGMDTAGKDGAIRNLLQRSNGISVRVQGFKVPTEEERDHDFLWRIHHKTPRRGEVVIFNRSHYEDVGVVKVHQLASPETIEGRYAHINHFEQLLLDSGTIVVKFFLHISQEEQKERLLEREEDEKAFWKLSPGDWKERLHWDSYQEAYDTAIQRCSSPVPWHIIPANKKWFRDLAVMETMVNVLEPYREGWQNALKEIGAEAKEELRLYRLSLQK